MHVEIASRNLSLKAETREFIERRLELVLKQFEDQIERVWVAVRDIKRNCDGEDKQCRIVVDLSCSGSVRKVHVATSIESAASQAIDWAAAAVALVVERRRRVSEIRGDNQSTLQMIE